MIVSIKQIGGHDGSAESRLAPAARCGVEDVDTAAVRSTWGICSQGGDVAWCERERRARLAQARTRARRRRHVATKSHDLARQDGRERAAVLAGVHGADNVAASARRYPDRAAPRRGRDEDQLADRGGRPAADGGERRISTTPCAGSSSAPCCSCFSLLRDTGRPGSGRWQKVSSCNSIARHRKLP